MIDVKKIILPNSITLHKGFLDHSFCDYVADNFKDYFIHTPRVEWNAYTLRDKNLPLYSEILSKFSPLVEYEFITTWINVTEYTKGIDLRHHKDSESSLTIVSEISDNYTGGRFLINKESYIKIVDDTDLWIKIHAPKFYKVGFEYCIQLRDEERNRQAKFKIK